ncbi:MAG TPA: hypothetical protein VFA20_35570 [Myxococcaceae bacterium]|nr:hypothetical protein [Myxococcaceae bacterium]
MFARRRLLLGSVILSIAACRTPGSFTPRTDGVDVRNTLEPLVQAVRAAPDDRTAGEAWSKYLAEGGMPADGVKPEALGKAIRASLPQLESISASGPSEVREVASAVGALHGRSVKARVSLEALREDVPVLKKIHLSDGQAPVALDWRRGGAAVDEEPGVLFLNARSPATADPQARRALLAREMSAWLLPDADSLSPLASVVYFRSVSAAAALSISPGTHLDDDPKLRARLPLLARELLASLDSAAPSQVGRFFGAAPSDPLLPRGSGAFLCEELGAALTSDLGSAEKVVRLTPGEFRRHASQALQRLSSAP